MNTISPGLVARFFGFGAGEHSGSGAVTHRLAKSQAYSVANPRGLQFTCTAGAVWLTIAGEPRDIILEAGESFRCNARAHLCATAFGASSLCIARIA